MVEGTYSQKLPSDNIIPNSQKVEATQVSIDGWMNKQNVVYSLTKYYSTFKKEEKFAHATTWMNLEDIMLGEISQSQKGKHCMIPLIRDTKSS